MQILDITTWKIPCLAAVTERPSLCPASSVTGMPTCSSLRREGGEGQITAPKSYLKCPHGQLFPGVPSDILDSKAGSPTPDPRVRLRLGPAAHAQGRRG